MLPVSLSRGALIAILACVFVLLGELVALFREVGVHVLGDMSS